MDISVFVSHPHPFEPYQEQFVQRVFDVLTTQFGFAPRTLGRTEYNNEVPLTAVRRLLIESNGVLTLGFRRYYVESGAAKPGNVQERVLNDVWLTSPWPHIESAMGYQLGLPIMLLREVGVEPHGVLDPGVVGRYVIEFDVARTDKFLASEQWRQPLTAWAHDVRSVARRKGEPPRLY